MPLKPSAIEAKKRRDTRRNLQLFGAIGMLVVVVFGITWAAWLGVNTFVPFNYFASFALLAWVVVFVFWIRKILFPPKGWSYTDGLRHFTPDVKPSPLSTATFSLFMAITIGWFAAAVTSHDSYWTPVLWVLAGLSAIGNVVAVEAWRWHVKRRKKKGD